MSRQNRQKTFGWDAERRSPRRHNHNVRFVKHMRAAERALRGLQRAFEQMSRNSSGSGSAS